MIRIVGVQRSISEREEFVLLQNQGSMRLALRGHVLMSDAALEDPDENSRLHIFREDVIIGPGNYVILFTGAGEPKWAKTKDQQLVYYTFMGRNESVWDRCPGPLHVLCPHHTYTDRREALVLR